MANVKRHQLTNQRVRTAPPGTHIDGEGLELRVKPTGRRNWILRRTVDGKRRNYGLGGFPEVSLREARALALEMRQRIRRGEDPRPRRQADPAIPTFEAAAAHVINLRSASWTSERHATQWAESLRLHVFPSFGNRLVNAITMAEVLAVLEPIWNEKAETASRVRQRLAVIFDYAVAAGWRSDNPCNDALKAALPPRPRQRRHHPALPYDELGDALEAIRDSNGRAMTKLALEFLILTASRAGEVRQATWDEIDWHSRTWTRPAEHMKMRKEHRVPLSSGALHLLVEAQDRHGGTGLIFPSRHKGEVRQLSNMAFEMLLRRAGYGHVTVHGFRASFRTWTLEQTDAPWAVAEAAPGAQPGRR